MDLTKRLYQKIADKVSTETVRYALKEQGLTVIKKRKKVRATLTHKKARLNWAKDHKN